MGVRSSKKGLVYGVGINDANYKVSWYENGKKKMCKYYKMWQRILERCYSIKYQTRNPTYKGCSVSPKWLVFSCFRDWLEKQNWEGKEPDKDLLSIGNRLYSEDTVVFIDHKTNSFINRSNYLEAGFVGTSFDKDSGKYKSSCNNPFTGKLENLGRFQTQEEAHLAWKARKHELACMLADLQDDHRVAEALRKRFK